MRWNAELGALAIGLALASGCPAAAVTEFLEVTQMTEAHRSLLSHNGVVLIATVADARTDFAERDYRQAERELRKASRLCRQIAEASPSLRLKSSFVAALGSLDPGAAKPDAQLDPIYRQLDVYDDVADAMEIRAQVDRARGKLGGGELEAAELDLRAASEKIVYFEVDLPIQETDQLLGVAWEDFQRGDYVTADLRLRKIQKSLKTFAEIAQLDVDDSEWTDMGAPGPDQ